MKHYNIDYINIMRGIAIVLVVIGHFNPEYSPQWYKIMHDIIYSFHMPLFLVISGYIYSVTRRADGYLNFIQKKINRLMIPYFTVSIVVIVVKIISEQFLIVDNPTEMWSFVEMFYLPSAGYYLWFIWVLFILFAIVPFFKSKRAHIILGTICLALYFSPYEMPDIFCLAQFQQNSIYFVMGMIIHDYKKMFGKLANSPIAIYLVLFIATNIFLICSSESNMQRIAFLCTASFGTILVMQISKIVNNKYHKLNGVLLSLSGASYFIYLFHTTFEGFAKAVIFKLSIFHSNGALFTVGAILVVCAGVIIPYILYRLVQKNKLLSLLFGVENKAIAK